MIVKVYRVENPVIKQMYYVDLDKVVAIRENNGHEFMIVFDSNASWLLSNVNYDEVLNKWKKCHKK